MIYADNAATTRLSRRALAVMNDCAERAFGNPSSPHVPGREAMAALVRARETLAALLNAEPREIYFTSGGTEADNQAIATAASIGRRAGKRHIVAAAFEHPAVLRTLERMETQGFSVDYLPAPESGVLPAEAVASALREDTALVTVMLAQNEVGTIQPVPEIAELCRERGVLLHTDAVQAVGHVPVDVKALGADMLSLSAHKFHGPRGVGALYVRRGVVPESVLLGGSQERGKRAGTENVPGVAGMAAALEEAVSSLDATVPYVTALRERVAEGLLAIPGAHRNGVPSPALPGTVNVSFDGVTGESLVLALDGLGVAASAGSACSSGALKPSHVLLAMGLSRERAKSSLRVSLSAENTAEDADGIVAAVKAAAERLRSLRG